MEPCPFCESTPGPNAMTRIAGLDVCDDCYHGDLPRRSAEHRGWQPAIKQWSVDYDDYSVYYTEIHVMLSKSIPFSLKGKRRNFWRKLFGFLYRGIKVGDPLFDNFVYLTTEKPRPVQEWLSDDNAQSILMDLLGDFSIIRVSGDAIYGKHRSDEYTAAQRLFVEIAAMGHLLEAYVD